MAKKGLTVAKATNDEFELVRDFIDAMEALFDGRSFFSREDEWRSWPDDDEHKKMLLEVEKDLIAAGEATWDGHPDNDLILFQFIKRLWMKSNYCGSFGRILFDCQVLVDNCCDPDLDYLEFKPSIMYAERNAMEKVGEIIARGEKDGQPADKILEAVKERIEESKKEE